MAPSSACACQLKCFASLRERVLPPTSSSRSRNNVFDAIPTRLRLTFNFDRVQDKMVRCVDVAGKNLHAFYTFRSLDECPQRWPRLERTTSSHQRMRESFLRNGKYERLTVEFHPHNLVFYGRIDKFPSHKAIFFR